jgi:hypothetical protein
MPTIGAEVGSMMTATPTVTVWASNLGHTVSVFMSSTKPTVAISSPPKKNSGHVLAMARLLAKMIMTKAKPPPLGVGSLCELLSFGKSNNPIYLAVLVNVNNIIIQLKKYT